MQNDLPSPPGKGVKGGNTFKSALESFSEFMSFSDKAVKTINEVQDSSDTDSGSTATSTPEAEPDTVWTGGEYNSSTREGTRFFELKGQDGSRPWNEEERKRHLNE